MALSVRTALNAFRVEANFGKRGEWIALRLIEFEHERGGASVKNRQDWWPRMISDENSRVAVSLRSVSVAEPEHLANL